jgi:hypothetical protein
MAGWGMAYGPPSIATDGSAPVSGSNVLQFTYPAGYAGGSAPGNVYAGMGGRRSAYAGFWFKTNANWQGHNSNVNKLAHMFMNGGSGEMYIGFYGSPGGPYQLRTALEFRNGDTRFWLTPNVSNVNVPMGTWNRVEWYLDYATGTVKFWLNGQLVGDYRDVRFPTDGMGEFQLSPTWGGMGDTKRSTDYMWFDHVLLKGS